MGLPGEQALRREREAILATMRDLSVETFESAPTLCDGWAPRDVLAHLLGEDDRRFEYVRSLGNIHRANERIVADSREVTRDELLARAERWVRRPALTSRVAAWGLLGDHVMHHQDVLRPLGRSRDMPRAAKLAILREGVLLGARKLLRYRVEPTDAVFAVGRGEVVRGTCEAIGLWLGGRSGVEGELEFEAAPV